jgi:hypothetical protein
MKRALLGAFQLEERKKKELKRNATFEGKKAEKKRKNVKASKTPFFFFPLSPSSTVRMFKLNTCRQTIRHPLFFFSSSSQNN